MLGDILSGNEEDRGKLDIEKEKLVELLSDENLELSKEQLSNLERFFGKYEFPCNTETDRNLFKIFIKKF
jgi:hypothetical protein